MALDELKQGAEEIQENIKAYVETNLAYYKLWGFKVAVKSTTLMLKFFLIVFCLTLILLFISIAGALAIGRFLDDYVLGFLSIAGVYVVFAFLLFLLKDKIMAGPIIERFSDIFFKE